jgi:hypothetical protein
MPFEPTSAQMDEEVPHEPSSNGIDAVRRFPRFYHQSSQISSIAKPFCRTDSLKMFKTLLTFFQSNQPIPNSDA